jgi:cytochrome c oxidase subunit 3
MPSIFTPTPAETERKLPGIGGKPPLHRRPTGGGGGGGDDDWTNRRRGPREALYRVRTFVFLGLGCDMVFFVTLIVVFYASQSGMRLNPRTHLLSSNWYPVHLPSILYWNTLALLLSSVTMELARRSIFREFDVLEEWLGLGRPALRRALPWLAATLLFGTLFLTGQGIAWRRLTAAGFAFDQSATPASYFFYVITGLHAAHLLAGVAALVLCLVGLGWLQSVERRQIAVDATAWYWHAMGLAWLILLGVLALGQ